MPLIEVLPTGLPSRAAQPGWAYVPDTGPIAAIQPGQRKRGRDDKALGSSAKQQKAIEQRLKDLDKENYKDVPIPIPKGDRDRKGKKMTSNVRRILGYSRNFGHYLADEEALIAAGGGSTITAPIPAASTSAQRDGKRRGDKDSATTTTPRRASGQPGAMAPPPNKSATPMKKEDPDKDVEMNSSPTTSPKRSRSESQSQHPPSSAPAYDRKLDKDPLLRTLNLPPRPSDRVMAQLVAEPPLSYSAARARPLDRDKQVPPRHFCMICGYWGKVRCRKCGERTCGLMECWKGHEAGGCGQGIY